MFFFSECFLIFGSQKRKTKFYVLVFVFFTLFVGARKNKKTQHDKHEKFNFLQPQSKNENMKNTLLPQPKDKH